MTRKLLIDLPNGDQQVISVGDGGGYYDGSCVIWDEAIDGPLPEVITIGAMVRVGDALESSESRLASFDAYHATSQVPVSITPRQGMLMLARYGLLTTVQTMLDGMSGQSGIEARIDFERANEWRRDWPLLNAMATAAGLSSAQVDQMFIEGKQLI